MDNLLMDRETLGRFVDDLIKKKPLPVNTPEELTALREKAIKDLDDKMTTAIFNKFTDEQIAELNQLLDRPDASEEDFKQFYGRTGIDFDDIIIKTLRAFSQEFILGGQNG